ncbi:MAG: hypothetical protein ISR65_16035 [Bacteriovoracaceae bacterium]|nr:hypothetical protein [Bacteriovoracaceae bacterium]
MKLTNNSFLNLLILLLLTSWSFASWGIEGVENISARRFDGESFQQARDRNYQKLFSKHSKLLAIPSAENVSVSFSQLDLAKVSKLDDFKKLEEMFYYMRDHRFMTTKKRPNFLRRISWLYPDDGCHVRAEMAALKLAASFSQRPQKIFIFGELDLKTSFSPRGKVSWWYHVALIVKVKDEMWIIDPAVDMHSPITLGQWITLINRKSRRVKFSICSSYTYTPYHRCNTKVEEPYSRVLFLQKRFLKKEWKRISTLNQTPSEVLGDLPPWTIVDFLNEGSKR